MTVLATKKFIFRISFAVIFLIIVRFFVPSNQLLAASPGWHDTPLFDQKIYSEKTQVLTVPIDFQLDDELLLAESKQHVEAHEEDKPAPPTDTKDEEAVTTTTSTTTPTTSDLELQDKISRYTTAILDPSSTAADRLTCPPLNTARYDHLRATTTTTTTSSRSRAAAAAAASHTPTRTYFFALDLRQVVDLLPRLLGSIVEAMQFLGPASCALSIVEGNSDDGTWEVLEALREALREMGVAYYLRSEGLDPSTNGDRIGGLVELREMALAPLRDGQKLGVEWAEDAVVVFLNDVAACAEDILELLHQRVIQEADMTCAMDWHHPGGKDGVALFYDVWISRTHSGNLFFDIPDSGSWDYSEYLFPFPPDATTLLRFARHQPFQVFACWNGAVAFTAAPVRDGTVGFRRVKEGECFQGEPQLFCKDLWWAGYGRIAVVPSVNLEYSDEKGRWIKESKGFVSDWVDRKNKADMEDEEDRRFDPDRKIEWEGPPDMVKCMPSFDRQSWLPWNESLVE